MPGPSRRGTRAGHCPAPTEIFMRTSARFALGTALLLGAASASAQSLDSLKSELKRLGDSGEFSGVVLIRKGGKTILHEAYGLASIEYKAPNNLETRFNTASV